MPEKICFSLYAFFNPVFSEEGPEEMDSRSMEEEEEEEEEELSEDPEECFFRDPGFIETFNSIIKIRVRFKKVG